MEVKSDFPMKFGNLGANLLKFIGIPKAKGISEGVHCVRLGLDDKGKKESMKKFDEV